MPAPTGHANVSVSARSFCLVDRMNFLRAVAFGLSLVIAGAAFAADPVEPAGPPLSAAPPRAPAARLPPVPPRSAEADAATYERCMKLAREDPAAARHVAERWRERGGGHPADHCVAVVLIGLGQYRPAASRLEKLAQAMVHAPAPLRSEVLGQAAQAWLLAGDPARAYAADGAALALRPADGDLTVADLLVDRAEAAGSAGWFDKALADLDRVLKADPARLDALIYRASAYRSLGRLDPALADIDKALNLAPDSVPALLERGNIRRLRGDIDGARQDWARVAMLAPGSAAETAAKANIEGLDAKGDPATPAKPAGQR
jgi:tetratricopeptide (TPR) repeat protein